MNLHQHQGHEQVTRRANDPVCGMSVDLAQAQKAGLMAEDGGRAYYFCGRGCKLEFDDDAAHFLDPAYQPSMEG